MAGTDEAASELISKANAAFVDEDYSLAVEYYTKAIQLDGERPDFYISRAHAFQKLDRPAASKVDALKALEISPKDPKALLRKGVACYNLGEYGEALEAFHESSRQGGSDTGVRQWISWCESKLTPKGTPSAENAAQPVVPKSLPVKHDWYQTEGQVCVTVLAKNLDPHAVKVEFTPIKMTMEAKLPDESSYVLSLNLLHPIRPEKCSYQVMKTKVEIKMGKADGTRWTSLEPKDDLPAPVLKQIPVAAGTQPPTYPSSASKKRDWDKIESDIRREEAEEKPEGEAALNELFQKIYSGGSDEVRRAMNKSFQESGGTVLSTNWSEVAKEKVTVKPPDGVEFKKWDE